MGVFTGEEVRVVEVVAILRAVWRVLGLGRSEAADAGVFAGGTDWLGVAVLVTGPGNLVVAGGGGGTALAMRVLLIVGGGHGRSLVLAVQVLLVIKEVLVIRAVILLLAAGKRVLGIKCMGTTAATITFSGGKAGSVGAFVVVGVVVVLSVGEGWCVMFSVDHLIPLSKRSMSRKPRPCHVKPSRRPKESEVES